MTWALKICRLTTSALKKALKKNRAEGSCPVTVRYSFSSKVTSRSPVPEKYSTPRVYVPDLLQIADDLPVLLI